MPFFGNLERNDDRCKTPNEMLADELDRAAFKDYMQASTHIRGLLRRAAEALRTKK